MWSARLLCQSRVVNQLVPVAMLKHGKKPKNDTLKNFLEGHAALTWTLCVIFSQLLNILPFSMPQKDIVCPNMKGNVSKIPECPTASGCILQYAAQHAFLAILTHNPLCRGRYITSTEPLWEHRQMTTAAPQLCTFHILQYELRQMCKREGQSSL